MRNFSFTRKYKLHFLLFKRKIKYIPYRLNYLLNNSSILKQRLIDKYIFATISTKKFPANNSKNL